MKRPTTRNIQMTLSSVPHGVSKSLVVSQPIGWALVTLSDQNPKWV